MSIASTTVKIRPRRGSKGEWEAVNPILLEGEIGIEYPNSGIVDGNIKMKFGDGVTAWNDLPYGIDMAEATSIHAGNVSSFKEVCIRTGTTTEWTSVDPVLANGEIVYDKTKQEIKIGDGIHKFSELRYIGQTWDTSVVYDFGNYDTEDIE